MSYKSDLLQKIEDKTFRVGIVGLGYVGLPLGLEFAEKELEREIRNSLVGLRNE